MMFVFAWISPNLVGWYKQIYIYILYIYIYVYIIYIYTLYNYIYMIYPSISLKSARFAWRHQSFHSRHFGVGSIAAIHCIYGSFQPTGDACFVHEAASQCGEHRSHGFHRNEGARRVQWGSPEVCGHRYRWSASSETGLWTSSTAREVT